MQALRFEAIYQERVWGGRNLESELSRQLPAEKVIGESWEVVDRPEANSVIAEGPHAGKRLRELIEAEPEAVMGAGWDPARPFPILVKWLDCQDRLSLQVHPPASRAEELQGEPKTECWYIASARPEAALIAGLKQGATREAFRDAIEGGELEPFCHRFDVTAGDAIFIPSGRLHAIDAGNLILEIQQNSDTTYRVYDWGRVGLDGVPRELHIEPSMKSIDFEDFEPEPHRQSPDGTVIGECEHFRITKRVLAAGSRLERASVPGPFLLGLVEGKLSSASGTYERGANLLVPAACTDDFEVVEAATFLVTDRFAF